MFEKAERSSPIGHHLEPSATDCNSELFIVTSDRILMRYLQDIPYLALEFSVQTENCKELYRLKAGSE